jgi:hypothetical protein
MPAIGASDPWTGAWPGRSGDDTALGLVYVVITFGCADGLLLLNARDVSFRKFANPAGAGGRMVHSLEGGEDWHLLLGNLGPDPTVVVDPGEGMMRVVPLPTRRLHFTLDPARPETGFAITEDGVLHAFGTLDGAPRGTVATRLGDVFVELYRDEDFASARLVSPSTDPVEGRSPRPVMRRAPQPAMIGSSAIMACFAGSLAPSANASVRAVAQIMRQMNGTTRGEERSSELAPSIYRLARADNQGAS